MPILRYVPGLMNRCAHVKLCSWAHIQLCPPLALCSWAHVQVSTPDAMFLGLCTVVPPWRYVLGLIQIVLITCYNVPRLLSTDAHLCSWAHVSGDAPGFMYLNIFVIYTLVPTPAGAVSPFFVKIVLKDSSGLYNCRTI